MSKCQNNCNCENKGKCDDCTGNCDCVVNNYVTLDLPSYPVLTGTITPDESLSEYLKSPLYLNDEKLYLNSHIPTYQLPTDMLVYPHSGVQKYNICDDPNAAIQTESICDDNKIIIDDVIADKFTKEGQQRFKPLFSPAKKIAKKLAARLSF